jgi:hypothetical protein
LKSKSTNIQWHASQPSNLSITQHSVFSGTCVKALQREIIDAQLLDSQDADKNALCAGLALDRVGARGDEQNKIEF